MKKLLSILLTFTLIVALVGCSQEKTETNTSAGSAKTEDSSSTQATTDEVTELSWLTIETPNITSEVYAKIIARFEAENPDIKIIRDVAATDPESYARTMFATEQLQDVMMGVYTLSSVDGALLPIEDETVELLRDDAIYKYDGNVLTIPWVKLYTPNMFYNKDMFAKYDLEIPQNWDEFLNVCEVLKENGEVPLVTGGPDRPFLTGAMPNYQLLADALIEYSDNYLELFESGELKWTDAPVKDMFVKWRSLIDNDYFHEGSYDFTMEQMIAEFVKGSAAMVCNGSWMAPDDALDKAEFDIGWFLTPSTTGADVEYVEVAYGSPLSIYSKTEHPAEAQKFVRFLISDEEAYRTFLECDQSSSTTKVQVLADVNDLSKEIFEKASEYTEVTDGTLGEHALPSSIVMSEIRTVSRNIFTGADIDEQLEQLQATYEKLVANE